MGLVPTMGALHKGHLSLIEQCAKDNDVVVVSIFVNPTQFNNTSDLDKYPRDLEKDELFLKGKITKPLIIFAPNADDIYDHNVAAQEFEFQGLEKEMEGKFRLGHFDGVATIVSKLFYLVQPENAYFGEKDYQQLLIVKKMVKNLDIPVNVVGCGIYREEDGLAMSSRNVRLSKAQRAAAPLIYKTLETAKIRFGTESVITIFDWVAEQLTLEPELELEYFSINNAQTLEPIIEQKTNEKYRAFIAVFAGEVRLIDNIALN